MAECLITRRGGAKGDETRKITIINETDEFCSVLGEWYPPYEPVIVNIPKTSIGIWYSGHNWGAFEKSGFVITPTPSKAVEIPLYKEWGCFVAEPNIEYTMTFYYEK